MFEYGVGLRNPLFFIGVVEDRKDPKNEGRVKVRAFGVHGSNQEVAAKDLPWAICVAGDYDNNVQIPKLNDFVFGVFIDGREAQTPLILGLIPGMFAAKIDPAGKGWGVYPNGEGELDSETTAPENFGQHSRDRLSRAEDLDETYIYQQEMGRVEGVKVGGSDCTWSEPEPAYNARYPYNRIIKTKHHHIELDDTRGYERVMIWHKKGSYIQIDANGSTTHKSAGDKFEVNDYNQHVYVKGKSLVYVGGDSHVYVKGNKTEEVEGDYNLIIRGNAQFGVGGQMNLNASEQLQARAAEVKIESNISNMSIFAKKDLKLTSGPGYSIHENSGFSIYQTSIWGHNVKTGLGNYNLIVDRDVNIYSNNVFVDALGAVPTLLGSTGIVCNLYAGSTEGIVFNSLSTFGIKLNSFGLLGVSMFGTGPNTLFSTVTNKISAPFNSIDTVVSLAGGFAAPLIPFAPSAAAGLASYILTLSAAEVAALTRMPEPPAKSTAVRDYEGCSMGSVGVTSAFYSSDKDARVFNASTTRNNLTQQKLFAIAPLLDIIGAAESEKAEGGAKSGGYDVIEVTIDKSTLNGRKLTQMTVQEVIDWQKTLPGQTASGRYQFVKDTLEYTLQKSSIVSGSDLFSPEIQDTLALELMHISGKLDSFLGDEITKEEFGNKLSTIWAALPKITGTGASKSSYEDVGDNEAKTTIGNVLAGLDIVKERWSQVLEERSKSFSNIFPIPRPSIFNNN